MRQVGVDRPAGRGGSEQGGVDGQVRRCRQTGRQRIWQAVKDGQGRLGGTAVKRLPSAQGVIPALWDRAPRQAPPL